MTFQQSLDLAELEADIAFERYLTAFEAHEHPAFLDNLSTQAQLAQDRYNTLTDKEPAH